jgi:uncharacterized protein (DUF1330 family)
LIFVLNLFDVVTGREDRYAQYLRRVQPLLDHHGAKVILYGQTRAVFMGRCSQQFFGLIAYPDLQALRDLSHDPGFAQIRPLRDESTTNYCMTAIEDFATLNEAAAYLEHLGRQNCQADATGEPPHAK